MISEISAVVPRRRTTLRGEIVSVENRRRPRVRTDVTIGDGTGTLVLRFVGRSSVPGFEVGRHVVVQGTPALQHNGDLLMLNPVYSFVSSEEGTG